MKNILYIYSKFIKISHLPASLEVKRSNSSARSCWVRAWLPQHEGVGPVPGRVRHSLHVPHLAHALRQLLEAHLAEVQPPIAVHLREGVGEHVARQAAAMLEQHLADELRVLV